MTPFYFGNPESPLYGVYHPPVAGGFQSKACLVCSPIGHENTRTYFAVRQLAQELSTRGVHVLRFSYTGLGDSSSPSESFSVDQSMRDIEIAIDELRDMSATRQMSLIGLRFGALLAAKTCLSTDVDSLVLWEPVFSGRRYVEETRNLHKKMLEDPNRFDLRQEYPEYSADQLLGHPYSPQEQSAMAALNIDDLGSIRARSVSIHTASLEQIDIDVPDCISTGSKEIPCKTVPNQDRGDWNNLDVENMYIPGQAISNIAGEIS